MELYQLKISFVFSTFHAAKILCQFTLHFHKVSVNVDDSLCLVYVCFCQIKEKFTAQTKAWRVQFFWKNGLPAECFGKNSNCSLWEHNTKEW